MVSQSVNPKKICTVFSMFSHQFFQRISLIISCELVLLRISLKELHDESICLIVFSRLVSVDMVRHFRAMETSRLVERSIHSLKRKSRCFQDMRRQYQNDILSDISVTLSMLGRRLVESSSHCIISNTYSISQKEQDKQF